MEEAVFIQEEEEIIRLMWGEKGTWEEDNTWRKTETMYVKLNADPKPVWLKNTEQTRLDTDMTADVKCMFSVRLACLDNQIWLKWIRFYEDHTETAFFQDHHPNFLQNEALPPRNFFTTSKRLLLQDSLYLQINEVNILAAC